MNESHPIGSEPYSGYSTPRERFTDDELSRVGPGTPCGESCVGSGIG